MFNKNEILYYMKFIFQKKIKFKKYQYLTQIKKDLTIDLK